MVTAPAHVAGPAFNLKSTLTFSPFDSSRVNSKGFAAHTRGSLRVHHPLGGRARVGLEGESSGASPHKESITRAVIPPGRPAESDSEENRSLETVLVEDERVNLEGVGRADREASSSSFSWGQRVMATSGADCAIPPPAHPTYDLHHVIGLALAEDAGDRGDVSCLATMTPDVQAEAQFLAKANGVIAGIALANMVFAQVDPSLKVEWDVRDGDLITKGQQFGTVKGGAQSILTAERVVLNFMQRMSGIATLTKSMAEAARPARILETRKTAPGLRLVDKWAVLIGGGENHRMGLFDMVMVKDNHIAVAGGIQQAISAVEEYLSSKNLDIGVEIETRTLEEVQEVLDTVARGKGRVTRVMLDNMVVPLANGDIDTSMLQQAVTMIDGRFETEASGNVTLDTVSKIGCTGVTYISSGALTHSVKALDISLNVDTTLALEVGRRTKRA